MGLRERVRARTGLRWHDEVAPGWAASTSRRRRSCRARFSVLRGSLARLERALINFFLDTHTAQHGYTEAMVPYLVRQDALEGTGQLPKFEEDLFKLAAPLNGKPGYLIPTAEVPLTNLHAGEILDEASPRSRTPRSRRARAEAGSHGKDTRGLFRQHQFHKVGLVKVYARAERRRAPRARRPRRGVPPAPRPAVPQGSSAPATSDSRRGCATTSRCGPRPGASARSRRVELRRLPGAADGAPLPKALDAKEAASPLRHTINGSGLAVGRALVALLETYQNDDGSLTIPEALRPYMGGLEKIEPQ